MAENHLLAISSILKYFNFELIDFFYVVVIDLKREKPRQLNKTLSISQSTFQFYVSILHQDLSRIDKLKISFSLKKSVLKYVPTALI